MRPFIFLHEEPVKSSQLLQLSLRLKGHCLQLRAVNPRCKMGKTYALINRCRYEMNVKPFVFFFFFRRKDKEEGNRRGEFVVLKWPLLKQCQSFIRPLQIKGADRNLACSADSEAIISCVNATVGQQYLRPRVLK